MTWPIWVAIGYAASIVYTLVGRAVWRYLEVPLGEYCCRKTEWQCPRCRKVRIERNWGMLAAVLWPLSSLVYSVMLTSYQLWRCLSAPHRIILTAPPPEPIVGKVSTSTVVARRST